MRLAIWSGTLVLLSALALAGCDGCVEPSPGVADAAAGHGDGGVTTGDAYTWPEESLLALTDLPLTRLCEPLATGFFRSYIWYSYLLAGLDLATIVQTCGGELDDGPYDLLAIAPDYFKTECLPAAPTWARATRDRIASSVQAGRARYDAARAMACLRAGRAFFDANGGFLGSMSLTRDAGGASADAATIAQGCDGWLVGLVATGGDCQEHWECGAEQFCKRRVDGCTGTCALPVAIGQTCDAFDRCADEADCVEGRCVQEPPAPEPAVANQGQRCGELDAGDVVCAQGLYCDAQGFCQPLPGAGEACASGACAQGLRCGPGTYDGGVCGPPRSAGALCTGHSSACELCSPCTSSGVDGGPSYCRTYRLAGESCGPDLGNCQLGLGCVRGQCRALVGAGATCFIDDDDESLQGTCDSAQRYCQGALDDGQGSCAPRAPAGQACEAPGLPGALRGSCLGSYVYCARSSATATAGTCTRDPLPGEPCGDQPGLGAVCHEPDPASPLVSTVVCRVPDGGPGTCRPTNQLASLGEPCQYTSSCARGTYCDEVRATCVQAPDLGEACGSEVDYTCRDGRCEYVTEDAGRGYRCVPYLTAGEACGYSGDDDCGPALRCAEQGDAGFFCTARAAAGEACESVDDCQAGLDCQSGTCVAGGVCARDACGGCSDTSSLSLILFFAMAVGLGSRRRRR